MTYSTLNRHLPLRPPHESLRANQEEDYQQSKHDRILPLSVQPQDSEMLCQSHEDSTYGNTMNAPFAAHDDRCHRHKEDTESHGWVQISIQCGQNAGTTGNSGANSK